MTTAEVTKIIENQLAHGETEDALQILLSLLENKDEEWRNQALILASQYRELRRNENMGLGSNPEKINRINLSLLNLNKQITVSFGEDKVTNSVEAMAQQLSPTLQYNIKNKATNGGINVKLWAMIGGALALLFIVFKGISYFSKGENSDANRNINSTQTEVNASKSVENSIPASNTQAGITINKPKVIYIDKEAKVRNFKLFETRYYPTDDEGSLKIDVNFDCPYENRGGCGIHNTEVELEVNGKTFNPDKIEFDKGRFTILTCNSDGLMTLHFDNIIPNNAQKVILKFSESLMSSTGKLVNPALIEFDLTKTKTVTSNPKKWVFDTEKDFNMKKDFGYIKLLSVKAEPYNDEDFMIKVVFRKTLEQDFYSCCIRILADNRRIGSQYREIENNNNKELEGEMTFHVPCNTQNLSLMLGKCDTKTPIILPIVN